MGVTKNDLRVLEEWINCFLRKVQVKVKYYRGYIVVDLHHRNGKLLHPLLLGLTKGEVGDVLYAFNVILSYEKEGGKR